MRELFINNNTSLEGVVKYEYYSEYFKDDFGYRFGRSQVDVCSTCEEPNTKIKSSALNEQGKKSSENCYRKTKKKETL